MHPLSPPNSDTFAEVLRRTRLAAIVRGPDPDAALRTVLTLAQEGVALVEVSSTPPTPSGSYAAPPPRWAPEPSSVPAPC